MPQLRPPQTPLIFFSWAESENRLGVLIRREAGRTQEVRFTADQILNILNDAAKKDTKVVEVCRGTESRNGPSIVGAERMAGSR